MSLMSISDVYVRTVPLWKIRKEAFWTLVYEILFHDKYIKGTFLHYF